MKNVVNMILIPFICILITAGCAANDKIKINNKLKNMSNTELINHFKMIEMRMIDIDPIIRMIIK